MQTGQAEIISSFSTTRWVSINISPYKTSFGGQRFTPWADNRASSFAKPVLYLSTEASRGKVYGGLLEGPRPSRKDLQDIDLGNDGQWPFSAIERPVFLTINGPRPGLGDNPTNAQGGLFQRTSTDGSRSP